MTLASTESDILKVCRCWQRFVVESDHFRYKTYCSAITLPTGNSSSAMLHHRCSRERGWHARRKGRGPWRCGACSYASPFGRSRKQTLVTFGYTTDINRLQVHVSLTFGRVGRIWNVYNVFLVNYRICSGLCDIVWYRMSSIVCTICLYIQVFMIIMFCAYCTYMLYTFDSGVMS